MKQKKITAFFTGAFLLLICMAGTSYSQTRVPVSPNQGTMYGNPSVNQQSVQLKKLDAGNTMDVNTGNVTVNSNDIDNPNLAITYSKPQVNINLPYDQSYSSYVYPLIKWVELNPDFRNYCTPSEISAIERGDYDGLFKQAYLSAQIAQIKNQSK